MPLATRSRPFWNSASGNWWVQISFIGSTPDSIILIAGILAVIAIGGLVEIAPLFYLKSTVETVEGVRPYTPLELAGRNISILCANAGTATFGPLAKLDPAGEKAQVQLNAIAVHDLCLAVLPGMLERRAGGILISGSAAGNSPIPNNATYVFTKAGVNQFTEALHYELKDSGVHVTLLAPGPVREAYIPEAEQSIVDKVVPDFLWTTYESCAADTISAMRKNRRRIVPGPLAKTMDVVSNYAPRGWLPPIMGKFYAQMGEE